MLVWFLDKSKKEIIVFLAGNKFPILYNLFCISATFKIFETNGSWYIWKEKQNLSFLSALFFAER